MTKSERSQSIKHSEGIDRISSLPEPLLSRILSLLPTKYAVATSLLSKRWKFLWTSITNLEFDDEETRPRLPTLDIHRMKFTLFVNRVLLLLNPPCIQNFQLKCHHKFCDPLYLDSWICASMGRTVQKLELHLVMPQYVELPLSHFHCKTLAVLKLKGDIHFKIAEAASISFPNLHTLQLSEIKFTIARHCSVSFPSLKDLLLDSVRYSNEESVHNLFASCSSLENLIINRSELDNVPSIIISIPSLISLTIGISVRKGKDLEFFELEEEEFMLEFDLFWRIKFHLATPALKYLYVDEDSMCCFTSENLSSLLEARIKIGITGSVSIDAIRYYATIIKFIGCLCNVQFLSISGRTLQLFWFQQEYTAPVFRNLSRLELDCDWCWCWSVVLLDFFKNMDNLEHLVLKSSREGCESHPWWKEPLSVPTWLLRSVTTISFSELITRCKDEVELVRYLLKNAKVLKMLTVDRVFGTKDEKRKCMQKLLISPRGSRECIVHVVDEEEEEDDDKERVIE